jgi:hypothetical protein
MTVGCEPPYSVARKRWLQAVWLLSCALLGCRCSRPTEQVDGLAFVRCAQLDPPASGSTRVGGLELSVHDRTLQVTSASSLRIAAFRGPVGAAFENEDLAILRDARPELVLYLGGLGDSESVALANLESMAALERPVLFIAGGSDNAMLVEAAFAALPVQARSRVLHASGLRELRIGRDRFLIVPGAAFGRYAVDEQACGFGTGDLSDVQAAAQASPSERTWLLSWQAPAGQGVSESGAGELGSPDLKALASAVGARGGLFAYPETHAGELAAGGAMALVVPRLGRVGISRDDGSRLGRAVVSLLLGPEGLSLAP